MVVYCRSMKMQVTKSSLIIGNENLVFNAQIVLGKVVQNDAKLDQGLVRDLLQLGKNFPFKTAAGKTVCTNDFYEGQARLDGAFCSYSKHDKLEYLQWLKENGVTNIEMESTCFAALTHQAGIRSAVVCVALLDRLDEDQVLFCYLESS